MAKDFKFADLYIPSVKKAMKAIHDGKPYDRVEVTVDIAAAIAKALKKKDKASHHG